MKAGDEPKTIIDVVSEFDYSTQNREYSDNFRKWRRNKKNPFAFNFSVNKNESIFIDGKGFIDNSPAVSEHETLSRIFYIIGIAMLLWVTFENIIGKVIIYTLDIIGVNIHSAFFSTSCYGGSIEIVTVMIILSLIKIYVPAIYMHNKLKMPLSVELMGTMNHPAELISAIAMSLIVCTITSIPDAYSSSAKEIYEYFRSANADISVWGQAEYVIYTIFDVIIMSVSAEILFRGAVFSALRQFGDIFAIIVTSVMAALLTQNFPDMLTVFFISVISSVGMLKSGSVFTAFAVRTVFKMYQLTIVIIEASTSENMFLIRNLIMTGIFIISIISWTVIYFTRKNKNKNYLAEYNSEISFKERLVFSFRTFPFTAVAIVCIIAALIKIIY
ncbi:MAG: CPBP family intramembrane metalloprotease [Prevotella sp.]|nr:CPBP family intramembrane metalloprotease [Alistipes senegalensis]MCM1358176.1 CPBP family intramembrane metalloprotease [Prevotella sp.]MCM1473765.1 CPBP family intramembrane metalloprotease [Muribaculaceae bacterium]